MYIENNKTLHLVIYQWNYINIVKSSNSFLPELEEIKRCIHRVENTVAGMGL